MRRLLVINPNTSPHVTDLLERHIGRHMDSRGSLTAVTAAFGAPYISDETSYAVGAHAALDAWDRATNGQAIPFDNVLIGCFGDPGLMALRESAQVPVSGLAEASFTEGARHGAFAVVTGGSRWVPILRRLAHSLGYEHSLVAVHTVAQTGAELLANPEAAHKLLAAACREVVKASGAEAVILGGAGLAGMATYVQREVAVPVIDSVAAGARWALR